MSFSISCDFHLQQLTHDHGGVMFTDISKEEHIKSRHARPLHVVEAEGRCAQENGLLQVREHHQG